MAGALDMLRKQAEEERKARERAEKQGAGGGAPGTMGQGVRGTGSQSAPVRLPASPALSQNGGGAPAALRSQTSAEAGTMGQGLRGTGSQSAPVRLPASPALSQNGGGALAALRAQASAEMPVQKKNAEKPSVTKPTGHAITKYTLGEVITNQMLGSFRGSEDFSRADAVRAMQGETDADKASRLMQRRQELKTARDEIDRSQRIASINSARSGGSPAAMATEQDFALWQRQRLMIDRQMDAINAELDELLRGQADTSYAKGDTAAEKYKKDYAAAGHDEEADRERLQELLRQEAEHRMLRDSDRTAYNRAGHEALRRQIAELAEGLPEKRPEATVSEADKKTIREAEAALAAPDFRERAALGAAIANPSLTDFVAMDADVKNPVEFVRAHRRELMSTADDVSGQVYIEPGSPAEKAMRNYRKLLYMTDEERGVYNYLLGAGRDSEAAKYLDALDRALNYRQSAVENENLRQYSQENKGAGVLMQTVQGYGTPLAYVNALAQRVDNALSGENVRADLYNPLGNIANASAATREGVLGDIESKPGRFFAQTALSVLRNVAQMPLGKGAMLAVMSMGAAGETYNEAVQSGASEGQAFALATIGGAAEAVTERLPLEHLFGMLNNTDALSVRQVFSGIMRQAREEGMEELISEYIGIIADVGIRGSEADFYRYARELEEQGVSHAEAMRQARVEFFVKQPIMAWAGGAVSGLMLGGAASGINAAQQAQYRGELREMRDKLAKYAETLPEEVRPQAPDDKALTEKALEQYRREIELARLKTAAEALPEAVRPWAPTEPTPEALERQRQRLEEAQYRAQLDYALEADALGELGELWEDEAAFMKKVAEEERYSIANTRNMSWAEQVRGYFSKNGSIKTSDSLYLDTSGAELAERGVMDAPLYIPTSVINKATRTQKGSRSAHELSQTDIAGLQEGIRNAPAIIVNPARNALVYITDLRDEKGRYIVAAFDMNNDLYGETAHRATSIHGRESIANLLHGLNEDAKIYVKDKNRFDIIADLQSGQSPELLAKIEPMEIIANAITDVKTEPVRTLGEEMQRQMMQRGEGLRREQSPRPTAADGGAELRGLSLPTLNDNTTGGMRNGQAEGAARTGAAEVGADPSSVAYGDIFPQGGRLAGTESADAGAGGGAAQRGAESTTEGAVYGGDGGGRFADAYAGGAGALRGARGGSKDNTRLIQARQRAAAEQPLLSSAELGASAGTEARTLQVVPEGEWDADLRESADFAYANGINEFVPVVGMLTADTGSGAVEVLDIIDTGSGRMIIKADSVKRSVAEVVRHAVVHYAAGEQHVRAFMQEVQSRYRPEAWSRMYETYRARWAPLTGDYAGMTAEQTELYVWEEIMGDAYAGVNNYGTRASVYSAEARRAMGDAIRTVQADQSAAALAERAGAVAQENSEALRRDGEAAERYSIASTLADDLNSVYRLTYPETGDEIFVGSTSQFLIDEIGARSLPVTMPRTKAYAAMVTKEKAIKDGKYRDDVNYHGLGPAKLKAALEASENPVAAYADRPGEKGNRFDRIVLVTDVIHDGLPVVVIEEVDTNGIINGTKRQVNKSITVHEKRQIGREIKEAADEGRLLSINKKRSQQLLLGSRELLPTAIQSVDFKKNIQDFWSGVKWVKSGKTTFTAKSAEPEVSPMQLAIQKGLEEKRQREKQRQLDVINRTNPAPNSYNTWVRSVEDIKTLAEAVRDPEWDGDVYNEDWTREQALEAIEKDSVTLYSSYPIENGVFVTPSRMEAKSYSGDGRVYTKTVSPDKVAWIDPTQGQYADTELRGLSLPTLEETESTERFSVEDGESDNPAPYAGDEAEDGGAELRGLSLPTLEPTDNPSVTTDAVPAPFTQGSLRRAALVQGDSTPEPTEAVRQAVRKVEPPEGYGTVSSYVADAMAREERGRAVRLEETAKDDFTGTEALMKLGVKIDRGVGIYQGIEQLRDIDRAAKQIERALKRAERRLEATEAEKSFAAGVAAGLYAEEDIPSRLDADKVMELADYYMAAESVKGDRIRERRRTIERINEEKMEKLFEGMEDEPDKTAKRLALIKMNYRTPERNMRHIFGDALGERINEAIFYPVQRNEAERFRFKQRMLDAVRTFEGADGKRRRLSRAESALVQQLLEGDAARDEAERSERYADIRNAAESVLRGGDTLSDAAREMGLNEAEKKLAERYAAYMSAQEALAGEDVDAERVRRAAAKYREMFDMFYEAINDFLLAHGYEPIGFIRGYAPHMQPEQTQTLLSRALAGLGINTDVTKLPSEIAGLTANYKPNKRWNPYFLQRTSDITQYDIVSAYESYVEYMSDVLYHTDDIMKVRSMSNYFRKTFAPSEIRERLEWANDLKYASAEMKAGMLRDAGVIGRTAVLSEAEINERMEEYISELYEKIEKTTKYSDLVVWIDNYANILAGKQSMADRSSESLFGREVLNVGNKLVSAFAKANVAANISSAINQWAQMPMIASELGARWTAAAVFDISTGRIRHGEWAGQSDFLTGKRGVKGLVSTPYDMVVSAMFSPLEFMDTLVSTVAVRGKYLKEIHNGKSHEAAMLSADKFGTEVMGSRMKGGKPTAFHSKNPVHQMVNVFQIEAFNSWEHISKDLLTRDFREIKKQYGKSKAALALAGVIVKALIATFALNRLAEELYGGTPAPFDIIGMTANFIASGKGLTTNAYLKWIIDNGMEKLGGGRLFGTDPNAAGDEPFRTEEALRDLGYNVVNDIPFARNVSALLGVGDNTLPMPDIYGGVSDIYKAAKQNGVFSLDTGKAALKMASQVVPGGRQLYKTALGAETVVRGGDFGGSGEKEKLKYPVSGDLSSAIQAMIFGKYATEESNAYYASGRTALSENQTALWRSLTEDGADAGEVYEAIHAWRRIEGAEELESEERSRAQRELLRSLTLTDEQKLKMYRELSGHDSTADKLQSVMDKGLSFAQTMDIYDKYKELYADEDNELRATEKATEFSRWLDAQRYSSGQKQTVKDVLKFFSFVPAEASRYEKLTAAGLDEEAAYRLTGALNRLKPESGKASVSKMQQYRVIEAAKLSQREKIAAIGTIMGTEMETESGGKSEFAKMMELMDAGVELGDYLDLKDADAVDLCIKYRTAAQGRDYGLTPELLISFRKMQKQFDANNSGTLDAGELKLLIDALARGDASAPQGLSLPTLGGGRLTSTQKAALWQLYNKSWSPKNNPYDQTVGRQIYNALHAEDDGAKLPTLGGGTTQSGKLPPLQGLSLPKLN